LEQIVGTESQVGKSVQEQLMLAHENFAAWVFDTHADKHDKLAVIDDTQTLTYGQLRTHVEMFAGYLHAQGYRPQQRIVISMDDSVAWPVVFMGALYVGMNPVLVSNAMLHADIERIIDISDAEVIISDHSQDWSIPCIHKDTVLTCCASPKKDFYYFHPDEPCLWLLSSGSTGEPKCIVNRHANLYNLMCLVVPATGIDSNSQILSTAKMSWTYGFNVSVTFALGSGATAHVISGVPAPTRLFNIIQQHHITHMFSVPAVLASVIKHKKSALPKDLSVFSSGESLPATIAQQFLDQFDIKVCDVFGMSETTQIYCVQTKDNWQIGTIGQPLPGVQCELRDEHGHKVALGQVGEIYINSPCQATMYWKDWAKTRSTFLGQWVKTGDNAVFNEQGNLVFLGRGDDLIKIKGLYVSPFEIESAVTDLPEVEDCTVVHVANSNGLAELHAFVVTNQLITTDYVRKHLANSLNNHKIPKHIKFVDSLPKTLTLKKMRAVLRRQVSC
jgi:benzoate-CoA ligase